MVAREGIPFIVAPLVLAAGSVFFGFWVVAVFFFLADKLRFLAPYRFLIVQHYLPPIAVSIVLLFVNLTAVFFAVVITGAEGMSRATGVPVFLADVIQGVSLLCMLTALLFTQYRLRFVRPGHA